MRSTPASCAPPSVRRRSRLALGATLLGLTPLLGPPQRAERLNPVMAPALGAATTLWVSPDGAWILYAADQRTPGTLELFGVPIDGAAPPACLGTLGSPYSTVRAQIDPTSTCVAFAGDPAGDGTLELYVAPLDGGLPALELSGSMIAGASVQSVPAFTPDGTRIVYAANADTIGKIELYSVPTDGSAPPVNLNKTMVGGGDVADGNPLRTSGRHPHPTPPWLKFTSDSQRVVYLADQETKDVVELWCAPVDGSAPPVKVNASLIPDGDVVWGEWAVSPDDAWVHYLADRNQNSFFLVLRSPILGGGHLRIAPRTGAPHDVGNFVLTPDGAHVVYREDSGSGVVKRTTWRVPTDGSLVGLELSSPDADDVWEYSLTPDGAYVVTSSRQTNGEDATFSAPLDGSAPPARLSPVGTDTTAHTLSPDGQHVLFADYGGGTRPLFAAPIDGSGAAVQLHPDAFTWVVDPQGTVLVAALDDPVASYRLFSVPVDGGLPPLQLSGSAAPPGRDLSALRPEVGQGRVAYLGNLDRGVESRVYSSAVDQAATELDLSGPMQPGRRAGDVLTEGFSPGARYVVYRGQQEVAVHAGLYAIALDRARTQVVLGDRSHAPREGIHVFAFDARGERVFYVGDQDGTRENDLFVQPLDGSAPPVKLNDPLPHLGEVGQDFQVTPDGAHVVYRAPVGSPYFEYRLYGVPADGSAPPLTLNDPLVGDVFGFPGGRDPHFLVTSDSRSVVYLAAQDDWWDELYSVPVDRSSAPIRLHPSFAGGYRIYPGSESTDALPFALTPDETAVLFVRRDVNAGVYELVRTPSDGSGVPVVLSGPMPVTAEGVYGSDHAFPWFRVTPDGARVVYVADQDTGYVRELYVVPTDGSAPSTKVSAPVQPFGDVGGPANSALFALDPTGARVVYVADGDTDQVQELYSAPLDGSAPAVKLNGQLVAGGGVAAATKDLGFVIDPTGTTVVYRADQDVDERFELYAVPIDGSAAPRKLAAMPNFGDVTDDFAISPDGRRVLFLADATTNGENDLYSVPLHGTATPRRLHPALPDGSDVVHFTIAPDGKSVLFRGDVDVDGEHDVYLAPLGRRPLRVYGSPRAR